MWRDGVRHILTRAMKLGPLTGESLYLVRCALADAHPRSGGTSDVASDRGAVDLRPFPYEPPVATKPCRYDTPAPSLLSSSSLRRRGIEGTRHRKDADLPAERVPLF
jgi:hypothetical protein